MQVREANVKEMNGANLEFKQSFVKVLQLFDVDIVDLQTSR